MEDGNLMNNINIVYEDNHLLVVEKPINIPVQEDSSKDKDLLTILKEYKKYFYQSFTLSIETIKRNPIRQR